MPRPRTPLLAVDVVIELEDRPGRPIVLIERRHAPLGHAVPLFAEKVLDSMNSTLLPPPRSSTPRRPHLVGAVVPSCCAASSA